MAKKFEPQVRETSKSSNSSQSILLEQYRALNSDYIQQRGEGVTRMNFFITAMSVVLGGALVFASRNDEMNISHVRLVLLAALLLLITIGIDVYGFLIQRNLDIDRDLRGIARVKNYFVRLDPDLENFLVDGIQDVPTAYLTAKGFGMRRSAEIIVGFLFGFAVALISSYFVMSLQINILIGVSFMILMASLLEFLAYRKMTNARMTANAQTKVSSGVIAE